MNKMIRITTAMLTLGLLATCTDLETDEVDSQVIVNTGGSTNVDPVAALGRIVQCSRTFTDQAGIYSMLEHTSDELIPPTRGVDWSDNGVWRSLYTHTWDPSHSYINNAWNNLNKMHTIPNRLWRQRLLRHCRPQKLSSCVLSTGTI
jgi:hypothetical protein